MDWIDKYVEGIIDYCNTKDVFEICEVLSIYISVINEDSFILKGNDAIYIRDYFDNEIIFIKEDLHYKYKKYLIAHELGHAILHVELETTAYNKGLIIKGKLERQADYFAIRLLDIELDCISLVGLDKEQLARELCIKERALEYV